MDDDHVTPTMTRSLPRFLLREGATIGDCVALEGEEAHHARVRRLTRGDRVALFDGNGRSYLGTIEHNTVKRLEVRIEDELPARTGESALTLTLAIAMVKADRFEWMIEKTTELGVTRIRPFFSEHSLAQPSARRQTRWQAIALSAAKQCGRSAVPLIDPPCDFDTVLNDCGPDAVLFWEGSTEPPRFAGSPEQVTLIVGPEGGFAHAEVERARHAGCNIATLGSRILRADTAAITAITLAQYAWGDLAAP